MTNLKKMITTSELLRSPIESVKQGQKVIIVGDHSRLSAAKKIIEKDYKVIECIPMDKIEGIAKHNLNKLRGIENLDIKVIFCHAPSKYFFNGVPKTLSHCYWLVPPGPRHIEMGKDTLLLDRRYSELDILFNTLQDDLSKECLSRIIRSRLEGNSGYLMPSEYKEYNHPIVHAEKGDIVFDCGAYDGDSSKMFSKQVGDNGKVFAFEPNNNNYFKLCERIIDEKLHNVIPLNIATWGENTILKMSGKNGSTKLDNKGDCSCFAASIDDIKRRLFIPRIDLIKMDVEGAEKETLLGASKAILSDIPKLMVSAYHKKDDLTELFSIITKLTDKYEFYLGHHNYYHTETDLYCINSNR